VSERHDVVIVGAGLVGPAAAMALLEARPGLKLAVFDKEDRLAAHQSGRNSGVLHAGLYYAPGSLKALVGCQNVSSDEDVAHPRRGLMLSSSSFDEEWCHAANVRLDLPSRVERTALYCEDAESGSTTRIRDRSGLHDLRSVSCAPAHR